MPGFSSPCGACKFLRRKCIDGCVFAPYFSHEQGAALFAAIHKVFGASNVSKLLAHLPVPDRCEAAATISYEAQARLQDPVYGCVAHIFALQQQVLSLQAELATLQAQAIPSTSSAFTSAAPPSQQQKQYNRSYLLNQQVGAQGLLNNNQYVKITQPLISGSAWDGVHNVNIHPQGSNYLPSSLAYNFCANVDTTYAPSTVHEGLVFHELDDLLSNMLQ